MYFHARFRYKQELLTVNLIYWEFLFGCGTHPLTLMSLKSLPAGGLFVIQS